jgi:hypothetical protein
MAQAIDDILKELDAGYNPQRQAINDRITQLQPQADAQVAGLKQEQQNAFGDITNGARDRGIGFSGIPIAEQAKYTGSTFLPAVANVQSTLNTAKSSLYDNLNNINLDQRKTAYSIRDGQQTREQAAADAAAARAASAAQSTGLASLFGGVTTQPVQKAAAVDPYAKVDRSAMQQSVNNLLKTNNVARINQEYNAIKQSAARGNVADKYKLELFDAAQKQNPNQPYNPAYATLIKQALNYKAPAPVANQGFKAPTTFGGLVNPLGMKR